MDKNKQKPDQANKPKEKDCSSLTDEEFKAYQEKERKKEKKPKAFFLQSGMPSTFSAEWFLQPIR